MKRFLIGALLCLLPFTAAADSIAHWDDASVIRREEPCKSPGSEGLQAGEIRYKTGKVVGMCWMEKSHIVWIIDDEAKIAAVGAHRFKDMPRI